MKKAFIAILLLFSSYGIFSQTNNITIRIGILAKRGVERSYEQWNPTAEYLSSKISGYRFVIVPLGFDEVYRAVSEKTIDFLFANSSYYVGLEKQWGITRIVTLKNLRLGKGYTEFGGVIFTQARRNDITELKDLDGKSFTAVDKNSFGGWQMAYREFLDKGIDPFKNFSDISFAGTHDAVVELVLSGKADAGTVRTDTIERMVLEGKIDRSELKILAEKTVENGIFPFSVSTRLYPEWPLAKLEHTERILAEKVSSALLSMDPSDPAAVAGIYEGWTIPSNYGSVDDALQALKIYPYEDYGTVSITQIFEQYSIWAIIIIAALFIIIAASIYITKLNSNLQNAIISSNQELSGREIAEKNLLAIKENLEILIEKRTSELLEKNSQLQVSLEANNALIKEIHHRVKNNLQIIISLMNMQHDSPQSNSGSNLWTNMERRITSISLVHELIFSSDYVESLSSRKLLELMSQRICEMTYYGSSKIKIDPDSVDQQIKLDIAIPLGLILSELIANSLQYSHKKTETCIIILSLFQQNNSLILILKDDGEGFPDNFILEKSRGLGMQLVKILTEQINGKINLYNKNGAVTELIFPIS